MSKIIRPHVPVAAALGIAGLLLAQPALADRGLSTTRELPQGDRGAGFLGLKVGALLPQIFSTLGASYFVELEGGYYLPFARRLLSVGGSFGFSAPTLDAAVLPDPRVAGGSYSYSQPSQQFLLGLTVMGNIPLGRVVPYLGVGPRLSIVRTPSSGSAASGAAIDLSVETSQQVGVGVPLGVNLLLGPGRLFAEVQLLWAKSPQKSTGDASFGALSAAAGYRLVF